MLQWKAVGAGWWVEGTRSWNSGDLGVCPISPKTHRVTGEGCLVLGLGLSFFTHRRREMGQFICKVTCSSNILTQIDGDPTLENKDRLNHFRKMAYFTDFYGAKKSFIGQIVFQSNHPPKILPCQEPIKMTER